ncbi:MAG: hypothetical protein KDA89_06665 [Planctomycetaceae bacterium]|nr:hypothetical protein [Planctomycetaceae bacterium]
MTGRKGGFIQPAQIDEWMAATTPSEAAAFYRADWPSAKSTGEARVPCYFNAACRENSYGQLTVNLDHPQKLIYCHSCRIQGNLLSLMYGMRYGRPFSGEKLKGPEFREVLSDLRQIREGTRSAVQSVMESRSPHVEPAASDETVNVPLKDSDNERVRALVNLDESFVTNVAEMSPQASSYLRQRPFLTPEVMEQWRMGYLPQSARSMFRGYLMYPLQNEQGDVLTWFGRDLRYEEKRLQWQSNGAAADDCPAKTRFVSGFRRGSELFGQHGLQRLKANPQLRTWLHSVGLAVVEGANDVIRLDTLNAAAVGLLSNSATDCQIRTIIRFSRQTARSRIVLLPDNDREGEDGFMRLLWHLSGTSDVNVRLGWSRQMFGGRFNGRQPESVSETELQFLTQSLQKQAAESSLQK